MISKIDHSSLVTTFMTRGSTSVTVYIVRVQHQVPWHYSALLCMISAAACCSVCCHASTLPQQRGFFHSIIRIGLGVAFNQMDTCQQQPCLYIMLCNISVTRSWWLTGHVTWDLDHWSFSVTLYYQISLGQLLFSMQLKPIKTLKNLYLIIFIIEA